MCYVEELNEDLILLAHVGWPYIGQSDQLSMQRWLEDD